MNETNVEAMTVNVKDKINNIREYHDKLRILKWFFGIYLDMKKNISAKSLGLSTLSSTSKVCFRA